MSSLLHGWGNALKVFLDRQALIMLFLGFSAGVPYSLIFANLSLWLGEAGIELKAITFFSWALLGYSFKFVWAPLIQSLPIPFLSKKMGKRRGWLLIAQIMVISAIIMMAMTDPSQGQDSILMMACGAVFLGFSSATQDIVIDAYRIELAGVEKQSILGATYNFGYRGGLVVSGFLALIIATALGTDKGHYVYQAWQQTYLIMAAFMLVGVITAFVIPEPEHTRPEREYSSLDYARLTILFVFVIMTFVATCYNFSDIWSVEKSSSPLLKFAHEAARIILAISGAAIIGYFLVKAGIVKKQLAYEAWIAPIAEFFKRYGWQLALLLLMLVGLYRISDIVAGVISYKFYQDMGFSKNEIAVGLKVYAVIFSLLGGFVGALLSQRINIMKFLMIGAVLSSMTNLIFAGFAHAGHSFVWMGFAIVADNFASGLAGAAFIIFLSSLTNVSFTAVQYAIFSSLMTLIPKLIGGYSGTIVTAIGYSQFFVFTTLIGIPIFVLILLVQRQLAIHNKKFS